MRMHVMPGFLPALAAARAQRPDIAAPAWSAAASTDRSAFARVRVCHALLILWAEFHSFASQVRAA